MFPVYFKQKKNMAQLIASAFAQTRQSLRCSYIKRMDVDKGSDQNHRPPAQLGTAAQAF